MKIAKDELIKVLSQFNPWWRNENISDLATWHRASFEELFTWTRTPPAPRAVLLSGARQIGKTTLLLQVIDKLQKEGVPSANILYATFDHPALRFAGVDAILEAWREREPQAHGPEYLFLDEAQFIRDWGTWVKHQVDFNKNRRIIFTGSAMPLTHREQESGVGRWHTIRLTTLSFYEYLQLKKHEPTEGLRKLFKIYFANTTQSLEPNLQDFLDTPLPELPKLKSLHDLFNWPEHKFLRLTEIAAPYVGHFHEYLIRGGFPQLLKIENISEAQRLLREDIVDKVLKRDMTALFGVRRVLDLEHTFLYLCMHDSGLLDIRALCENLEVKRPTAQHFIELLEATHLIYRLQPFGYGKDILRGKSKIYLADAAIAPAVLLKGKSILENPSALGIATETAIFKHLFARRYPEDIRFSYWHGKKNYEVDLVAEINDKIIPFEVKYRSQHTGSREITGLIELCKTKTVERAYVITKNLGDIGLMPTNLPNTKIMRIPAPLLCYWIGESELSQTNPFE